ncbi:MAG TPA: hypothetical protein VNO17_04475 [Actinomycetota bacterium]|nr:hypothetical protein [Actinomycetota bacterium]
MSRAGWRREDGLIGKALVISLVLLALLVVAAYDAGSILVARYRVADLAERATIAARQVYDRSGDRRAACAAAVDVVEAADAGARIPDGGCVVDTAADRLSVTVRRTASTLVVRRIDALRRYGRVRATDSLPLTT